MTYFFETYGCQMNTAESAALTLVLKERAWEPALDREHSDLVLLNTCSVRATAEQRVLGRLALYEALRKKPAAHPFTLIVTGCMASRLGEKLRERFSVVDYVMGTSARALFPRILDAIESGQRFVNDDEKPAFAFSSSHLEEGQFRAFVPIMHGCNNFCAYCIVPYVRGPEVSRSPASIMDEIHLLAEKGVREITLLGQNVNSYCWGNGDNTFVEFPELLERIARETEQGPIRWIRFLSSHPKDLSSRAIAVMAAHPTFCRHIHLCVQHGSNAILAAMNRRYTRERYLELVAELRSAMPDITFSTDILIGFPGETESDLEQTLELMDSTRFLYAYMYHYNPREGTAAFELPNRIPESIKRERLARVIALQKQHTVELLQSRRGKQVKALVEGVSRRNADEFIGRTEHDEMVVMPGRQARFGSFVELTLSSLKGNTFRAKEILCYD
ncbi:MAG: tRNA (N6-isopentenyl adenosine(37)-C2)-methylthiotransferase MiaB [Treponema sp.]|nr:tRNA (N6-isopentenyl adenosine(37)-C2)-methylthiotransferase MiaB [Treponema sp.]